MGENSEQKLPKFDSIGNLVDFFDENDLGSYVADLPPAYFDVELNRISRYFEVDSDVAEQIAAISRRESLPSSKIVNSWLREKLSRYSEKH
jgi:aromatic ring-opening dioxygenase LigB subunit